MRVVVGYDGSGGSEIAAALLAGVVWPSGSEFHFVHDVLFEHQDALLPGHLKRYAAEIGLDPGRFTRDLRDGRRSHRVAQDVDSADASGVVGIPTFFINDVLFREKLTAEAVQAR
jgi:2-hydroxychromene-2-carboxylate isomerase